MSQWLNQRNEFYRVMVTHGITKLDELEAAFPLGYNVPQTKIEKWFSKLLKTPKEFSEQRRYVNRFKIGADPEFVFQTEMKVPSEIDTKVLTKIVRVDAQALSLKQGPAFGADNNGRLAEIRPHPSRSAITVVASILSTLRWLAILYPTTLKLQWVAGAYLHDDGLGGHVHFGRKRPNRKEEVEALDTIEELLVSLNVFPLQEVRRRRQGDGHGNAPYGQPGDIRLQTHGYEYRTWPSWLDSPELAFITLTLSKLAVHDPGFFKYKNVKDANQRFQQVRNLLSYYKGVDDDARLALLMIQRKFPKHIGGDFKARWGLSNVPSIDTKIGIIPPSIPVTQPDELEVFQSFLLNFPLDFRVPKPTWEPTCAPFGYEMVIDHTNTIHQKGLGEMIWDICCSKSHPFSFVGIGPTMPGEPGLLVSRDIYKALPSAEKNNKWLGSYQEKSYKPGNIIVSTTVREIPKFAALVKDWLVKGPLPLWKVSQIKEDSYLQWKANVKTVEKKKQQFHGIVLYADNIKEKL